MSIFLHTCIIAFATIVITYILPEVEIGTTGSAFFAAFFLGLVNALIKPSLPYLQVPTDIRTLVLITFCSNFLLFNVIAGKMEGIRVRDIKYGLLGTVLITVLSLLVGQIRV
jgi:putative membrane protein